MQAFVIAYYEIINSFRLRYFIVIMFLMPMVFILILGNALSSAFVSGGNAELKAIKTFVLDERAERNPPFSNEIERQTGIRLESVHSREELFQNVKSDADAVGLIASDRGEAKEILWEIVPGRSLDSNAAVESWIRGFAAQLGAMKLGEGARSAPVREAEQIETVKLDKGSSYSALEYYSASMLIMTLLYTGMSTSIGMVKSRQSRLLSRLVSMPIPNSRIVLGYFIGNTLTAVIQAVFLITGTSLLYGVDWGDSPLVLTIICALTIVSSISLGVVVGLLAKKTSHVIVFFQALIVTMMFVSGGYSPIMGALGEKIGPWTLNYWAFQPILHMMSDGELYLMAEHMTVLGAIAITLGLSAFTIYRKAGFYE
ncbi:ABC transporter permease [Paenibacillus contaminans]|uniref:ABC-2 type transporter transmembrane domain-containing protein n=1 Tax=Paenibacillus contaminans TaxID=450362 RepID=A0A329MKP3_9BACL|nr:ABC transporter permease [Paenibacillus contaminans]RAV19876.1 hypothetical protein DQG23_18285 [Paenibacillus contaminans]